MTYQEEPTEGDYEVIMSADGSYRGIRSTAPMAGAVYLGVRSDAEALAGKFVLLTMEADEPIDPKQSTGFFIKMQCPPSALSFKFLLQDTEGNYWRTTNASAAAETIPLWRTTAVSDFSR